MAKEKDGGALVALEEQPRSMAESEVGATSAMARERYELEGQIMLAKRFPRDEIHAEQKILAMCERPEFAERALYSYPRGGTMVRGESVNLSRAMERAWGNITSGFRIVSIDDEYVHLQAIGYDLESNTKKFQEHKFKKSIYRKARGDDPGGWRRIEDERELRELIGRHGSILERNCALRLMPADLRERAKEQCMKTIELAAQGQIKMSKGDTVKALLIAFGGHFVTQAMIEARLTHPIEDITKEELADLRTIYNTLKDGAGVPGEFFERTAPTRATARLDVDAMKAAVPSDAGAMQTKPKKVKEAAIVEGEVARPEMEQAALVDRISKYCADQGFTPQEVKGWIKRLFGRESLVTMTGPELSRLERAIKDGSVWPGEPPKKEDETKPS